MTRWGFGCKDTSIYHTVILIIIKTLLNRFPGKLYQFQLRHMKLTVKAFFIRLGDNPCWRLLIFTDLDHTYLNLVISPDSSHIIEMPQAIALSSSVLQPELCGHRLII